MEQSKALSEHFHRSRLTSMVMSAIAFVVSVVNQQKLANLKIFEVEVGALNRSFLLAALTLAAFVSLISLWLSFWNEGLSYLRNSTAGFDPNRNPLPTMEAIENALEQVKSAAVKIGDLAESDELRQSISQGPVQLNDSEIYRLMNFGPKSFVSDAFKTAEEHGRFLLSVPPTSSESIAWLKSELENAVARNIDGYLEGVAKELIDARNPAWDGPSITRLAGEAKGTLVGASTNIKNLGLQIERYRRSLRFSRFTHQAETGWIGVGVPTVMFVVAGLHSWGATMWSWFPTLPSLFE